ncbi:hypothetical protein [Ramlibacter pallidus]|uniref:Uncharacterized protein n=1 Tax=Ramlibacter pallidus TaxID=2780087 RepID=A0ABR9RZH3_9BURK|nr:hypothetical protein [Ramlibacter pallidus]MBE7366630.1 hypothetical protein [Ramlibacter pallidus]
MGAMRHTVRTGRKLALAAALVTACGAASAQSGEEKARNAAIADGLSTLMGLAAGGVEANPIGPVLAIGMKAVALRYAETLPDTERPAVYAAATAMWGGAAANNVCVTAALLTGGSFAPACLALGAVWAMKTWKDTEHERLFWEGCAMLRQYAGEPALQCIYTPPGTVMVYEIPAEPPAQPVARLEIDPEDD